MPDSVEIIDAHASVWLAYAQFLFSSNMIEKLHEKSLWKPERFDQWSW